MLDRGLLINSSEVLLQKHGEQLKSLLGKAITRTWSVWDTERDEWFADEAVILEVEGSRLELAFMYLESIALTWNQIDLSTNPKWIADWSDSFTMEWRSDTPDELKTVLGKTIKHVFIIEYFYELTVVEDRQHPENVGRKLANWILHGLEFDFDDGCLVIYNDLDKTGISLEPITSSDYRKVEVA